MEGPALGVPFSHRAYPGSPGCSSRRDHKDLPLGFEENKPIGAILLQGRFNTTHLSYGRIGTRISKGCVQRLG